MLAKLLKRKESRQTIVESTVQVQDKASNSSGGTEAPNNGVHQQQPLLQYRYQRPDLIGKVSQFLLNK